MGTIPPSRSTHALSRESSWQARAANSAPAEWPKHHGHERRSVELIEALCARLRVPGAHRELAILGARYHGIVHRAAELRPATLLEMLEQTDAFRRPQRFADMLLACEADARGRTGFENTPYPQREWLLLAAQAAATARPDPAAMAGAKGEEMAQLMRNSRLAALRALKKLS